MLGITLSCCTSSQSTDFTISEESELQAEVVELTEEYQLKGFNHGMFIRLFSDGSFSNEVYSWGCTGGGYQKIVSGEYAELGNRLEFEPLTTVFNEYSDMDELTTDTVDYYHSDSTKIQPIYYKVSLGGENLLISNEKFDEHNETFYKSSSFVELANGFNSGRDVFLKKQLLATRDTIFQAKSLEMPSEIPDEWREYFLSSPIDCNVVSVVNQKEVLNSGRTARTSIYSLDIGESSGIRIGMKLYSQTEECEEVEVFEVGKENSKARGSTQYAGNKSCKRNSTLSTRRKTN